MSQIRMPIIIMLSFVATGFAWLPLTPIKSKAGLQTQSRLYNVPPPAEADIDSFQEYASRQSPPASFFELQQDCIRSARLARRDGHKLIEVEFPPLPANVLEMDDVSAYDVAEANLNLALEFAKGMLVAEQGAINKVAILLPDDAEADFAIGKAGSANPQPGVEISSLRRSDPNDDRIFKPEQLLLNLFGTKNGIVQPLPGVDMYIILVASAQELPDIEELHLNDPDKTIVFYNLKLDILRGDLGNPAFPGKDLQDRFLSRVKPIYYLRTRQYSRSTTRPPFMVNFQGCLFRAYPGQFQTLLDTGNGRYRRVLASSTRPPLGTFKQQLIDDLKKQGVIEEEGSTLNFLRTGYKTSTWWEDERPEASDGWMT
ncbi:hypothetical protein MPSEU_000214800 [Mayamaea pseudoterrestris]|nr:hypothetical protein MPSEU_000214800 [Mayamaea pseudoterrestris]